MLLAWGVDSHDSSLTYNTLCSSQQVPSSMPITHFPPSPPSTLRFFSVFKTLLGFASLSIWNYFFHLPFPHGLLLSFPNSTYEWKHTISVFSDWLISLSINTLQFHPRCCRWQDFILSHCQLVFHCIYKPHLLYSSVDGQLGSFHNLAIVDSTAITLGYMCPYE